VYELIAEIGLPSQIILDEYVSIAHAFFEGAEPKFINGLLDAVSRDARGVIAMDEFDHPALLCSLPRKPRRDGLRDVAEIAPGLVRTKHRRGRPFPSG
jgi:hypothetical protein